MKSVHVVRSMFVSVCLIVSLMAITVLGQTPTPATGTNGTSGTTATTGTTGSTETTGSTQTTDTTETVVIEKRSGALAANGNFVDAVTVKTTTNVDHIDVSVKSGNAQLYLGTAGTLIGEAPGKKISIKPESGISKISIITREDTSVPLQVTPFDSTAAIVEEIKTTNLLGGPATLDSLGSKLSYLQLFVGTTFTNNYGADNKSTGFGNSGQLIRLTFDTMWPRHRKLKSFGDGFWHTETNLEFSKFPFGISPSDSSASHLNSSPTATADDSTANQKGLENAFSGSVGLTWEPNRWALYDKRDANDVREGDNFPYDAYRLALFGRAGVTTRSERAQFSHSTSIDRFGIGMRFTHKRSQAAKAKNEDRNVEPIRFIEISLQRFSQFDIKHDTTRIVIDGGLRLAAFGNDVFPIYLGGHLNTGPGADDLRVFIGVLMKLDKLGALVKQATSSQSQ